MSIVVGYDAIGANTAHLPQGAQAAGYTTGEPPVPWTAAQFAAHPGAVRIDQNPAASDPTADVLDVENGAATPGDCPGWVKRAIKDFDSAARPGQRWPCIYASQSNLTAVANALIAGGVPSGVFLWVANWSVSEAEAVAMLTRAGGPFPVVGVQFRSGGFYDTDIWSSAWLGRVSGHPHTGPYVHAFDGTTTVNAGARSRGYTDTAHWLAWQDKLRAGQGNRIVRGLCPPAGTEWLSSAP